MKTKNETDCVPENLDRHLPVDYIVSLLVWRNFIRASALPKNVFPHAVVSPLDCFCRCSRYRLFDQSDLECKSKK